MSQASSDRALSQGPIPVSQGPIAWMARNHIAANLLMFILLGGGLWLRFGDWRAPDRG